MDSVIRVGYIVRAAKRWIKEAVQQLQRSAVARWPLRRWRLAGAVAEVDEVPSSLPAQRCMLVGSRSHPKWLAYDCPCERGHRVLLNLDRTRRPFWTLRVSWLGRVTVSPSVADRGREGPCHYFLSNGLVEWVPEAEEALGDGQQFNV